MSAMDLPNAVTVGRYLCALTFLLLCASPVVDSWPLVPLVLLIVTFTSDVVDGALARRTPGRDTAVGQVLDSATDSYTFVIVFLALYVIGAAPLVTLAAVAASRAIFDLVRWVGLARGRGYASPIPLSKAKGFVYSSLSGVLYAQQSLDLGALSAAPARTAVNAVVVSATVVATVAFLSRHRDHLTAAFVRAAPIVRPPQERLNRHA